MSGSQDEAVASLEHLVKHVRSQSSQVLTGITYQELAYRIGRINKHGHGHGHGMGRVLGRMGHLLLDMQGRWGEPVPHIQSLVVNKTGAQAGLPDEGIREFWTDYPGLSRREKVNWVQAEYSKIAEFGSRWIDVLADLGVAWNGAPPPPSPGSGQGCGEGESSRHLALKEYVSKHPALVGANHEYEVFVEYVLPSMDTVDVLFRTHGHCIAVEVKSRVSDSLHQDYERGLYQCVKYRSLLEAMTRDPAYPLHGRVEAVLVLESSLPSKYRAAVSSLDVPIKERVAFEGTTA